MELILDRMCLEDFYIVFTLCFLGNILKTLFDNKYLAFRSLRIVGVVDRPCAGVPAQTFAHDEFPAHTHLRTAL